MLTAKEPLRRRAGELLSLQVFYPAIFESFPSVYPQRNERLPYLDLPFLAEDYVGVRHAPLET